MTVGQLEELLAGILDKDMLVMIDTLECGMVSVCGENSKVLKLTVVDDDEFYDYEDEEDFEDDDPINDFHQYDIDENDDEEHIEVLLLVPCNHVEDIEEGELNSQLELN